MVWSQTSFSSPRISQKENSRKFSRTYSHLHTGFVVVIELLYSFDVFSDMSEFWIIDDPTWSYNHLSRSLVLGRLRKRRKTRRTRERSLPSPAWSRLCHRRVDRPRYRLDRFTEFCRTTLKRYANVEWFARSRRIYFYRERAWVGISRR